LKKWFHLAIWPALLAAGCGRWGFGTAESDVDAADSAGSAIDAKPTDVYNIAFVTAQSMTAAFGGVQSGDAICQSAAISASLPGTYRAWLSDASATAPSRLAGARGWVRPDGEPIADLPSDLIDGFLLNPIGLDELGRDRRGNFPLVFTGTGNPANALYDAGSSCGDWTSTTGQAWVGAAGDGYQLFTYATLQPCGTSLSLLCFGISRSAALRAPGLRHPVVFTTAQAWTPAGLAAADAVCAQEASSEGLTGTYRALLAPTGATATSRLANAGQVYYRPDGVRVGPLTQPMPDTFVNQDAGGRVLSTWLRWGSAHAPSTATQNCVNWTSASAGDTGYEGNVSSATLFAWVFNVTTVPCNSQMPIVCAEDS
jgi:hypothetical protein